MASFTGEAQNAGIIGALVNTPPSLASISLEQSSAYLGQPSPGMVPRSLVPEAAPVPPTQGSAAPMPGESTGSGAGTFGNAAFMQADANLEAGAGMGKGLNFNLLA